MFVIGLALFAISIGSQVFLDDDPPQWWLWINFCAWLCGLGLMAFSVLALLWRLMP